MDLQNSEKFNRAKLLIAVSLALLIHLFFAGGATLYYYYSHEIDAFLAGLLGREVKEETFPKEKKQNDENIVFIRPENFAPSISKAPDAKIIDLAKPKNQTSPKKARFYSQYNSSTNQETTSVRVPKNADPNKETHGGPASPKNTQSSQQNQESTKQSSEKPKNNNSNNSQVATGNTSNSENSEKNLDPLTMDLFDPKSKSKSNDPQENLSSKKFVDLNVQASDLNSVGSGVGRSFVEDFAPSVTIGQETILNTEQIKQVQYFTRMKRSFRLAFNPAPPLISYYRGKTLDRSQVVVGMKVKVGTNGRLSSINVFKSSGIPGYDQSAMSAVKKSSPLGAPPKKYLDPSGQLNMTWYFITYIR